MSSGNGNSGKPTMSAASINARAAERLQKSSHALTQRIRNLQHPAGPSSVSRTASAPVTSTDLQAAMAIATGVSLPASTTTISTANTTTANTTTTTNTITTTASGKPMTAVEKSRVRAVAQQELRDSTMSMSGKLFRIIEFLKEVDAPQTMDEVKQQTRIDLRSDRELLQHVVNNAKILFQEGRFSYRATYNVRTKEDLLELIRKHWESGQGGLHIRDLKDTWPDVLTAVQELSAANQILVTRKKDKPMVLYYNEYPNIPLHTMDGTELSKLWSDFQLPDEAEVQRELASAGLKLLEVERAAGQGSQMDLQPKGRRRRKTRQLKITNTHLKDIDLSIDYVRK